MDDDVKRPATRADLLVAATFEPNPGEPAGPFLRAVRAFLAADAPETETALREAATATAAGGDAETIIANLRRQ